MAYASLLPVPLTTVHQPCHDIGEAALHAMLERLDRPKAPARNVLLDCWVVVRESAARLRAKVQNVPHEGVINSLVPASESQQACAHAIYKHQTANDSPHRAVK